MPKTVENIQDHAAKLMEQINKETTQPEQDSRSLAAAAALPAFSKGTVALDEQTGKPVMPSFGDTNVEMPKPTETQGGETAQTALDSKPSETRERDAQGRYVGSEETPEQPEAQPQTKEQKKGAEAAEQAAEQITAKPQDEYEDWEFEEPDLTQDGQTVKIPLKFPKQYATSVKRGYQRRAEFDRMRTRWGNAAPILEPLLQDGRFAQILPLLQRAMNDQAYGEFVWQAYQRAQQGLPLTPQAVAPAPPPVAQPQALPGQEPGFTDPLLEAALNPVLSRLQAFEERFKTQEQRETEAAQRQRQVQQQQEQTALTLQAAHRDLATMYPSSYKTEMGPNDPNWNRACKYAQDAGYIDAYGLRGGLVFAAQQLAAIEAERLAATASPAAQALESVSQQQVELARQQAAQSARAASGTGGATAPPTQPKLQAPSTRDANGKMKPPDQYLAENMAYLQQARAS